MLLRKNKIKPIDAQNINNSSQVEQVEDETEDDELDVVLLETIVSSMNQLTLPSNSQEPVVIVEEEYDEQNDKDYTPIQTRMNSKNPNTRHYNRNKQKNKESSRNDTEKAKRGNGSTKWLSTNQRKQKKENSKEIWRLLCYNLNKIVFMNFVLKINFVNFVQNRRRIEGKDASKFDKQCSKICFMI